MSRRVHSSYLFYTGLHLIILFSKAKVTWNTVVQPYTTTTTLSPVILLPYFDFSVQRNITVTVGQTGFLNCRVERLGDKDVSFIRKKDLHILTAGTLTYTSDQRFTVLRRQNPTMWTLQIKYPQTSDSGTYECQINTEPKMSLSYTFNVIELKAQILGPSDLYVKSGSQITIMCMLTQGPHDLGSILWYKGNDIIEPSARQNSVRSSTSNFSDRISIETDWSDGLKSKLTVRKAIQSDTGNYTCVPTIAKSSSVWVQVISGEHPAAMQHNSAEPKQCRNIAIYFLLSLLAIQYFSTCFVKPLVLQPNHLRRLLAAQMQLNNNYYNYCTSTTGGSCTLSPTVTITSTTIISQNR